MEVLLFTLFFVASLIFFILGKDDFGRKEKNFLTKDNKQEGDKKEVELEST